MEIDSLIDKISSTPKSTLRKCFKLAKSAATASDWKKQKIGAVIAEKGKILTVGWNTNKECPMQKQFNKYRGFDPETSKNSMHAEINALSRLIKIYDMEKIDISKTSVYVFRALKNGDFALARPCPACMAAIKNLGIKKIFYTGNNSIIEETI